MQAGGRRCVTGLVRRELIHRYVGATAASIRRWPTSARVSRGIAERAAQIEQSYSMAPALWRHECAGTGIDIGTLDVR